jgi:hypothetical protein
VYNSRSALLAIGLSMVGFVAHPVFPTIYRDMKTPQHYDR